MPLGDTLRPTRTPFLLPGGRGHVGGFLGLPTGRSGRGSLRFPPALAGPDGSPGRAAARWQPRRTHGPCPGPGIIFPPTNPGHLDPRALQSGLRGRRRPQKVFLSGVTPSPHQAKKQAGDGEP